LKKINKPGFQPQNTDKQSFHTALNDVYTMMGVLKNMYLPSHLDECENINYNNTTDKIFVPLILDYSALASDEKDNWYSFKKP